MQRGGGRKSISHLAETGGKETELGEGGTEIYKPGFLKLQAKKGGSATEIRERGNVLSFIGGGGGRREVILGRALPARELAHMMEGCPDKTYRYETYRYETYRYKTYRLLNLSELYVSLY